MVTILRVHELKAVDALPAVVDASDYNAAVRHLVQLEKSRNLLTGGDHRAHSETGFGA